MAESDNFDDDTQEPPRKPGYRSPPPEHQYRPGQSGNPRGRPRGAKGLRSELMRTLNERVTVTKGGKRHKVNRLRYLVETTIRQGLEETNLRVKLQLLQAIAQYIGLEDASDAKAKPLSPSDQRLLDQLLGNRVLPTSGSDVEPPFPTSPANEPPALSSTDENEA